MVNQEHSHSCQTACARQLLKDAGVDVSEANLLARIGYIKGKRMTTMITAITDAKAALESAGLFVSVNLSHLLIGGWLADGGDGLRIFKDACGLNKRDDEWIVLFPAGGLAQYEVPGTLADSVALVLAAYENHRKHGGPFHDACKRVLKDAERYQIGGALAGV